MIITEVAYLPVFYLFFECMWFYVETNQAHNLIGSTVRGPLVQKFKFRVFF
jgi:hypothetical protein